MTKVLLPSSLSYKRESYETINEFCVSPMWIPDFRNLFKNDVAGHLNTDTCCCRGLVDMRGKDGIAFTVSNFLKAFSFTLNLSLKYYIPTEFPSIPSHKSLPPYLPCPPDPPYFHLPSQKSRPPRDINQIQNKLEKHFLILDIFSRVARDKILLSI